MIDNISLCGSPLNSAAALAAQASHNYPVGVTTVPMNITDGAGNTASCSFAVNVVGFPTTNTITLATYNCNFNLSCNGGSDGSASISSTGGCGPYSYVWLPSNQTGSSTSNLSGGMQWVVVTDGNNNSDTVNFTLAEPDPLVVTTCNDQNVAMGYAPMQSALLTADGSGGCAPYTYCWDHNLGCTQTVMVSPAFTTTYTVTMTDANGCSSTAQVTVNVIDVRCAGSKVRSGGSKMGRVMMCGGTGSNGPRNKCVKQEDVSKKLCQGYTFGPCGAAMAFDGGNCGDPDYLSCKCNDGVSSVCFTYTGVSGATVVISQNSNGSDVLASWSNVMNGQVLCVDSIPTNLGSHGSHGGSHGCGSHGNVLAKKTYVRVNGGSAVKFYTGCDKIHLGEVQGDLTLTGFTDGAGAICNAMAPPICDCSGKITDLRLTYVGPNGAAVKIYKNNNHANMIWSGAGLNTFAAINLSNPSGLPGKIYVEIVGSGMQDIVITVKCGELYVADRYYYFDIAAYKSVNGGSCPVGVLKDDVSGSEGGAEVNGFRAYPNPFNDATTIEFSLSEAQHVNVEVFTITGVKVITLFDGEAEASAAYKLNFKPEAVSSGIYFARMTTSSGIVKTEKLILQK